MPTSFVALGSSQVSVSETLPFATITLVRSGDLNVGPVTVDLQISPGTALPGSDYSNITIPPVVFQNGQAQAVVNIPLIADGLPEPTETFSVSIVNVSSNVDLLAPRTVLVDIIDDINPVQPPVSPPLVSNYTVSLQTYIGGINAPLNLDFTSDGSKVYIATKDGFVYLHDAVSGARISTVLDLTAVVNNVEDRGLLDIELHPDFLSNGYFYVFYVVDPPGAAGRTGLAGADGVGNRYSYVVRYQADAATGFSTVVAGSATVILGNAGQTIGDIAGNGAINSTEPANVGLIASDLQPTRATGAPDTGTVRDTPAVYRGGFVQNYLKVDSSTHAGGALAFGPDGMLYVSVGDGTSFNLADPRSDSVQNINSLAGKILRIDPLTGRGLTSNPFYTTGMSLDDNAAKVYQLGLRNPFSMGFDQAGRLFITSTGWFTFEQIFTGPAGANFGWPYYEGGDLGILQQSAGYNGLPTAAAFYAEVAAGTRVITPAYRAFSQDDAAPGYEVQGIVGGNVIYTGNRYPAVFQNDFFFADFPQGEVFSIDTNDFRQIEYLLTMPQLPFLPNPYGPVHMTQAPDGYVYLVDYLGGTIHRLLISGGPNGGVTAVDDVATVAEDTVLTLAPGALLGNDTNTGGGTLTIESVTAVSGGTVALVGGQVRFTPNANFNGTAVFDYRAANGTGGDTGRVLVTVTPVEDSPIAVDDNLTAVRGRANILTILANDSEPDGQTLTVVSAVAASGTPVTINPDGTLSIAPPAGAAATDTITYVIRDPGGRTDTGLVNLALVDTVPVTFTTRGSAATTPTAGTFTITPATAGQAGAVISTTRLDLASSFTVNFQMFFGATDGGADGTAFVLQAALPAALPGGGGSDMGYRGLSTGIAIEFDTYLSDPAYGDIAEDHLAFHAATTGTRLGTPVALPNIEDNAWHAVAVSWNATTQTLSVTVDGTTTATLAGVNIPATYLGGSNFAHFGFHGATGGLFNLQQVRAITASGRFEGQNAPPVAVDDTRTTAEDTVLTITAASLVANDTDADLNPLTITSVTAVTGGTVSLAAGVITFTPTANFNGAAAFDYVVSDGQGGTDTGRVAVTVTPANDAPVAVDDTRTTALNTALAVTTASLTANDTDVEGNALSITAVTAVSGGTVSLSAGVITFTPTLNFTGPAAFDYTVSDGAGGTDVGRVTVTVGGATGGPPVAVDDTRAGTEDTVLTITAASLTANDTDPDLNPLTITAVTAVTGGTVSLSAGVITFTPTANFNGPAAFDYTVADGTGGTDVGRVTVNLAAVNDAPVAVADTATAVRGTAQTIAVLANDTDVDDTVLTVTSAVSSAGAGVTINPDGTVRYLASATVPATGTDTITYTIRDVAGLTATSTVAVTVTDVPPPAPFSFVTRGSATPTATAGTFTITPAAVVQTGAVISTTRLDLGASFTMNFELFLGASDAGSDGVALVLQAALPVALPAGGGSDLGYRGIPNGLAVEFDTFNSTAPYADIAADHLAFHSTSTGARLGGAVALPNIEDNTWHVVAVSWNATTQTLSVTVDGTTTATLAGVNIPVAHLGGSTFAHFGFHGATGGTFNLQQVRNVTVAGRFEGQGIGAAPVAVDDTATGTEDTVLTLTAASLTANDTDADLNPLTITSVTAVTGGTVSLSGGVITFTPTANFNGAAAFDYVVSDGQGNSDVGRVAITLAAVEDAPIAVADTASVTRGAPATIAVLANDREVDGQALTVVSATAGSGAAVVINPDGTLRYTPPASGTTDTISYTIRDPGGLTASSTVAVSIAAAPPPFVTRGNASATATAGTFTVTPAAAGQSGAVISSQRLDMAANFTLNFDLFLGTSDAGADGMALVLQAALPTTIPAGVGSDLGYRGLPNGLAVEFDTFASGAAYSDITADHLAFHSTATGTRLGGAVALPNVEDGAWHAVVVTWTVATQTLTVTVDGTTTATLAGVNIPVAHLGGSSFAHFGFHAATGGGFNLHQVRNITVAGTFEAGGGGAAPSGFSGPGDAAPVLGDTGSSADSFLWAKEFVGDLPPEILPVSVGPTLDQAAATLLEPTFSLDHHQPEFTGPIGLDLWAGPDGFDLDSLFIAALRHGTSGVGSDNLF